MDQATASRQELVELVCAQQAEIAELRARLEQLEEENRRLRRRGPGPPRADRSFPPADNRSPPPSQNHSHQE